MAKGYYICICIGRLYHLPEILMCHIYLSFYDSIVTGFTAKNKPVP